MEKPRKKETYEHREVNGATEVDSRYNAGWNDHADAMSTWLEGEVDELIEDLKRVDHHTVAEEIWRIQQLLRKLTGKV